MYKIPSDSNIKIIIIPEKAKKIYFFKKVLKIITFFFVVIYLKSLFQYFLGADQTTLGLLINNLYSSYSLGSLFGSIFTVYLLDSGDEDGVNSGRVGDWSSPERPDSPAERPGSPAERRGSPAERPGSAGGSNTHGPLSAEQIAARQLEIYNQKSQALISGIKDYNKGWSDQAKDINNEGTAKVNSDSKFIDSSSAAFKDAWYQRAIFLHAKMSEGWFMDRLKFADRCFEFVAQTPSIDPAKKEAMWKEIKGIMSARARFVDQQALILKKNNSLSVPQIGKELYIAINKHHNDMTKCWNRLEPVLVKEFKKTSCYGVNRGLMEKLLEERRKVDSEFSVSYNEYKKALHPIINRKSK